MITKPTGIQVVKIQGPQFNYVGNWSVEDIDQHVSDYTPNDELQGAFNWIRDLFLTQKGKILESLTESEELNGTNAMFWYSVYRFLKRSQAGKSCPDDRCKTQEDFEARLNFVKEQICHFLDEVGLEDQSICDYVNKGGVINGLGSDYYSSCSDYSTDKIKYNGNC